MVFYLVQAGQRKIWNYRYRYTDNFAKSRQVFRSAKTADLRVAKQRAWQNYLANTSNGEVAPSAFDMKVPDCQAVIGCYVEHISTEDGARTSPATVNCNAAAFGRFVRYAFDRAPGKVSLAELDSQAVKRWRSARYAAAGLVYGRD